MGVARRLGFSERALALGRVPAAGHRAPADAPARV
jgi:hypothetical protein